MSVSQKQFRSFDRTGQVGDLLRNDSSLGCHYQMVIFDFHCATLCIARS